MPHLRPKRSPKDWPLILGIPYDSSCEDVKIAFRNKAKEAHPDVGGSTELMTEVNLAYERALKECGQAEERYRKEREEKLAGDAERDRRAKKSTWRPYDRPYTPPPFTLNFERPPAGSIGPILWVDGRIYETAREAASYLSVEIHDGETIMSALKRTGHTIVYTANYFFTQKNVFVNYDN